MNRITGNDLIAMGFQPGPQFANMLHTANTMRDAGYNDAEIEGILGDFCEAPPAPVVLRERDGHLIIAATHPAEQFHPNTDAVWEHAYEITRLPVVERVYLMPDMCPVSNVMGHAPVGSAIISSRIHPGFHSADVCCSMFATIFSGMRVTEEELFKAIRYVTHFGPGGRATRMYHDVLEDLDESNPFLHGLGEIAASHLGTQGDGNHFSFVGHMASTGEPALVTHHGSRGLGYEVYRRGTRAAAACTQKICPDVPKHMAWLEGETAKLYWEALQYVRKWAYANHEVLHNAVAEATDKLNWRLSIFNEHNYVWKWGEFYAHGKGATPMFMLPDEQLPGRPRMIPLNMDDGIMIVNGGGNPAFGQFAPHGAGRLESRTSYLRNPTPRASDTKVEWFCGAPDLSEMAPAYRPAQRIEDVIRWADLAKVVDRVLPYGVVMAGRPRES